MSDQSHRDESPSLTMRAVRAVRESSGPKSYEVVAGLALMAVAVWRGIDLLGHDPDHSHTIAWLFVAALGVIGLWLVAPVRAERLWREAREVLPILPPPKDGGGGG